MSVVDYESAIATVHLPLHLGEMAEVVSRHPVHFHDTGDVVLKLDGVLFRVHQGKSKPLDGIKHALSHSKKGYPSTLRYLRICLSYLV